MGTRRSTRRCHSACSFERVDETSGVTSPRENDSIQQEEIFTAERYRHSLSKARCQLIIEHARTAVADAVSEQLIQLNFHCSPGARWTPRLGVE